MAVPGSPAIVLPVYNEGRTVGRVLDAVREVFDGLLIVVDDGSEDETPDVLQARRDVALLSHGANRGYGRSLIEGFSAALEAGCDAVLTMDCDGQHEPAHIPEFLAAVSDSCDIASGSRYLPDSPVVGTAPTERRVVNDAVTREINRVTGWSLTDAFCGFKAYRADVLATMRLDEDGYALPLQVWAEAYRAGVCVVELPVARIYFDGDRSFGQDLDDPEKRLGYYLRVWNAALRREA